MRLEDVYNTLKAAAERKTFEKWRYFLPVPKQQEFLALGATIPERLLIAGNRLGKTECAAYEISRHLTGVYPPWWTGKRFTRPVRVWAAGTSAQQVRDTIQDKLCGPVGDPERQGAGFVPRDALQVMKPARSVPDAYDSLQVKHASGASSRLVFKTYEQERRHWQGAELDIVWFDEEPPLDIYTEGRTRLGGKGISLMTFTPLFGMSEVVRRFFDEQDPLREMVKYGIMDATFMTEQQRRELLAGYPSHERQARAFGDPFFSEGRVFTTPADNLREPRRPLATVPVEWAKIWGVDFGIDHPFAAVLYAWDKDADRVHILHVIRMKGAIPLQHAEAMRRVAPNVPVAWPHDGHQRDRGSGEALAAVYKRFGLSMIETHATHVTGGFSTEGGLLDMDAYMQDGRWRVSEECAEWFDEYGQYHRDKKGMLVKERDDLMSASRIAHMMRRRARPVPLGGKLNRKRELPRTARDVDFDVFA